MPKDYPDHHDAELVLRLYELRRESTMRASRAAMASWFPKSYDEFAAIFKGDHPNNAAFRQVTGYWEMAYGMARHGVAHPEFLVENCTEGLFYFVRFERILEQYRASASPRAFRNTEWVVTNTEAGKETLAFYRKRLEKILTAV